MSYYAVANGFTTGVFTNWNDCNESIKGYKNAKYKKFKTKEEATNFINEYNNAPITNRQPRISSFFGFTEDRPNDQIEDKIEEWVPDYYVYTDGACINNGKIDALSGVGIYFGENDVRNVSRCFEGKQTNNTAELMAIIETYDIIKDDIENGKKIGIVSDSEYAIKCVSSYGEKCNKKHWCVDIPNKELVKKGYELYKDETQVKFIHIKAHTNNDDIHSIGNDNADKLANQAIGYTQCPYTKIFLEVPFVKKDSVKSMGAKWDPQQKKWYIYENNENKFELLQLYSA